MSGPLGGHWIGGKPHAFRIVTLGRKFGTICACGWENTPEGDKWRATESWAVRDWNRHLGDVVKASPEYEAEQRARERNDGPMVLL
jgi:hypothetical protein